MTQGAIDLVQAQLEAPAAAAPPPLLLGSAAAAAATAAGPQLLQAGPADAQAQRPLPRPLQQYSWVDAGSTVHVRVPVAQLRLGGGSAGSEVCCEVRQDRLELSIQATPPLPEAQPAAAPEEFSFSPGGSRVGASCAAATPGPAHHLRLHPLSAPVVPAHCRCFVEGPPALLPCSSSGSLSNGEEQAEACTKEDHASQAAAAALPLLSIRFCLPPRAEALVVELAKADPQQQWEALQAPAALQARSRAAGGGSPGAPPDLTGLRWAPCTSAAPVQLRGALLHCTTAYLDAVGDAWDCWPAQRGKWLQDSAYAPCACVRKRTAQKYRWASADCCI